MTNDKSFIEGSDFDTVVNHFESGGNPNYSDYGGKKPRYRLYFNRQTSITWWCWLMVPSIITNDFKPWSFEGEIKA